MHRHDCEREAEIIAALRSGTLGPELEKHANACDICSRVAAVSKFLQSNTAVQPVLPDSDFVWWKAHLRSRQMTVERATRSIVLLRRVTYGSVGAAALWLVFAAGHLGSILRGLSRPEIWPDGVLSQSAVFLCAGALALTLLGSLYLARMEK